MTEQTDAKSAQTAEQVSPQQELARQSEALIRRLDQTNQEALRAGRGRLGWQVGEDEQETFILSQPVDRDDPTVGPGGRSELSRTRFYVVLTKAGVRAIRFQKGVVDTGGKVEILGMGIGTTLDNTNERGEGNFRRLLDKHTRDWEDNGERLTTKRSSSGTLIQYKYSGGNPGFIQDPNGREFFRLDMTDWIDSEIAGLISQVPENVAGQAYTESMKQARRAREIPVTEAQRQLNMVNQLLADLNPPPPTSGPK